MTMRHLNDRALFPPDDQATDTSDELIVSDAAREKPAEGMAPSREKAALWKRLRADNMTRLMEEMQPVRCCAEWRAQAAAYRAKAQSAETSLLHEQYAAIAMLYAELGAHYARPGDATQSDDTASTPH
jgi:hypothetical protein